MGTSGDAASLQKLHEEFSTTCKALEGLGCESLIVTVTKNGYCQLGSKKGRKYLEEKFSLIMDFIHFCQDPKEPKTESEEITDKDASGDAPHTPDPKEEDDMGDDEMYEEMVDEADEEGAYEFLHFNYLDVTGEEEENEDDDDDDEENNVKDKIIVVKQEDIVDGRPVGKLRAVKTITKSASRSTRKAAKKKVGAVKKSPSTPRTPISKDRTFDCDQCDKKYRRYEDLIIHKRKHTGETPFACDICDKSFRSRNSLRSHQISHSASRHYGCDICGKVFTRASGIYKHKFTHSAATPHTCETCGKAFADPSNLKKHMRLHTGTKKFGCEDCPMRFWEKKDLEDHRRVHTGEKPFECDVCGDRFRRKKNLATHKRKHNRGMTIPVQTIILS